jgi:hypothetical protein
MFHGNYMNFKNVMFLVPAFLLLLSLAPIAIVSSVSPSQSNPSVIPGTQANLVGPYISSVTYPIFTSDHASIDALLAGQANILDYPPDFSDLQTAYATEYVNVTSEVGSSFEDIIFNMYSSKDAGYYLPFRQAIAQLVNYSYMQSVVLNGIQGIVSQNPLIPSAFGPYSTNNITNYQYNPAAANASLAQDPQIAWNPTAHPTNGASNSAEFACTTSQTGVWQYATSPGSGVPNGTDFTPRFYTRPDHATWFQETQQIWKSAASIGLCLDMKQVVHFSGIYPIVYAQYSDNWDMYFGGASYSAPLDPVGTLYFGYGSAGFVTPFDNTPHFYNSTVEALLDDMFKTSNVTQAELDSQQVVQILTYQIPTLNMWWDSWAIPSLNNHGGTYWAGYVDTPGFGTWTFSVGYYTLLNLHMVDSNGNPITGGNAIVNLHEAPDDFNIFFATSVYDFDVLNSIFFDTAVVAPPGAPYAGTMIPWMLTSAPTVYVGVNTTTPHGYNIVDGTEATLNFMNNITWQDNVPLTAADFNFSIWYANLNGVFGPYVNNTGNFVGLSPSLTDSQVNSNNSVTVWLNSTSFEDYKYVILAPIVPMHLWSAINSTDFNNDIDPTTHSVNGTPLITGMSAFYWSSYVTGQYINLQRFPGYFRTNIQAWQLPAVQVGNAEPVSFNITQMGTPIPSSASASATASLNGQNVSTIPLSLSGGNWTGTFQTTGWQPGFYEVTVTATYTDSYGLAHTALQFYGLNVAAPPPPSTATVQVTVHDAAGNPVSGAVVTLGSQSVTTGANGVATFTNVQPGSVTVTISASGFQNATQTVTATAGQTATTTVSLTPTVTTPPPTNYTLYIAIAAIIVIILIIAGVAYSRRSRK